MSFCMTEKQIAKLKADEKKIQELCFEQTFAEVQEDDEQEKEYKWLNEEIKKQQALSEKISIAKLIIINHESMFI